MILTISDRALIIKHNVKIANECLDKVEEGIRKAKIILKIE